MTRHRNSGLVRIFAIFVATVGLLLSITACSSSSGESGTSVNGNGNQTGASNATNASASTDTGVIDNDKFSQIESGMTYEQVVSIIGSEGTEDTTSQVGDITTTIYEWQSDSFGVATVTFQNDKVVNKTQVGMGDSSEATATMDKYNQVQTGMTLDQVTEIMGGEGQLESDTDVAGTSSQIYIWSGESLGSNMTVTLMNGTVSAKAQYGLD